MRLLPKNAASDLVTGAVVDRARTTTRRSNSTRAVVPAEVGAAVAVEAITTIRTIPRIREVALLGENRATAENATKTAAEAAVVTAAARAAPELPNAVKRALSRVSVIKRSTRPN